MKSSITEVSLTEESKTGYVVANLDSNIFPNLDGAEAYPFDLMADYWTPEDKGENKRVFFDKIDNRTVLSQESGELLDLECAFFFEQVNGEVKSVSNGSRRLVGAIQSARIQRGTPLLITYMGKKSNKTNSFKSDNWSIKVLRLNID